MIVNVSVTIGGRKIHVDDTLMLVLHEIEIDKANNNLPHLLQLAIFEVVDRFQ